MNHNGSNFRRPEKSVLKDKEVFEGIKGVKGINQKPKNTRKEIFESIDEDEDDYFKEKYKRESAMDYMDDEE